jgi:gluconate 2-dehydrogenase alpha chain
VPTRADVVIVGMGAVGGLMSKELASAGLEVVGLERGAMPEFEDYAFKDSIRAFARRQFEERSRNEPILSRAGKGAPTRATYPSTPGNVVGGGLLSWTGSASRFSPGDFKVRTNEVLSGVAEKAGANLDGYDVPDWPIDYDDLEPYYEKFEYEMGVSGKAGQNPFAGPRKRDYPVPPIRQSARSQLFEEAARKLGYHPYQATTGILSQAYQPAPPYDARIPERPGCVYCAQCNFYGCHVGAKTSTNFTTLPVALETGNLDLRTHCKVFQVNVNDAGRVTGVSYFDADGNVVEQEASVVILGGYLYEHTRLLLLSKTASGMFKGGLANTSGMVGKYIMAHGDFNVRGLFDDSIMNGFIGPNGGTRIDDFYGNNFDHTGLGFIRGGPIGTGGGGTPLERYDNIPPGWPRWGDRYKDNLAHYYTRAADMTIPPEMLPHQDNVIELDPTRKDAWGIPLPRVTFTFHENEKRMGPFLGGIGEKIMKEMGASHVWTRASWQPTRTVGGTRMGADPKTSVVNGYCQSHDVDNLFMVGSSVFPTMTGYAATPTVAALAYRASDYIIKNWSSFA